jgi:prepilin-type N-terminal cleavage/methylation domain-containing protein
MGNDSSAHSREFTSERVIIFMKKLQKGFTLIELMIVIAIIAILAAILIPNFLHARAESVTAACEGNEKQLATAEEEYSVDNGGAYASLGVLTTPYISTVITDPVKKGNAYTVTIPGTGSNGSYQISDAGGHDTTTTTSLTTTTGGACATCASVLYAQASGIHGN